MNETAIILDKSIDVQTFQQLMSARGQLEGSALNFGDGAHVFVRLCHSSHSNMSPENALEDGAIEDGDSGDIIIIGSSKHPKHRDQVASSLIASIGGRVVDCD